MKLHEIYTPLKTVIQINSNEHPLLYPPTPKIHKDTQTHYGLEGMKYIVQVYEGEINGHGEKEGLPTEYQYEFKQEILKHVHEYKSILEKREGAKKVNREFLNQFLIYDSIEKFKSLYQIKLF